MVKESPAPTNIFTLTLTMFLPMPKPNQGLTSRTFVHCDWMNNVSCNNLYNNNPLKKIEINLPKAQLPHPS